MRPFSWALLLLATFPLFSQQQPQLDFTHAAVSIKPLPDSLQIQGQVNYTFSVLQKPDSIFLDAHNMSFKTVELDGKKVKFTYDGRFLVIYKKLKEGDGHTLNLTYTAKPKQTVYFVGWQDSISNNEQIWTQGQGKYTSHWLPSFDDMNEKVEFDVEITANSQYQVIANGKLVSKTEEGNNTLWKFDMAHPMSSYLLAFAIGDFRHLELQSASGVPLELYYEPEDSLKVEPTYRYSKEIFDFLEKEIGVAFPWQDYKQVPVRDFLYGGMENTTATLFSKNYVVDSIAYIDQNYMNVNAHELAHQWFGDLVTEHDGASHWLQEGFATFYAYWTQKKLLGDEFFYWKLWETAQQLDKSSRAGEGQALTDPKASSLTFYEKGAWACYALYETLGETHFKKGIKEYLNRYAYKNATVEQFIKTMEEASGQSLVDFVGTWLKSTDFPMDWAQNNLRTKCPSLDLYLKLQWDLTTKNDANDQLIHHYWSQSDSEYFRQAVVQKYPGSLSDSLELSILEGNQLKVRQALAGVLDKITPQLKKGYESLLQDRSYITQEVALYKLWVQFPEDRNRYLDLTKGIIGMPNKNVRMLWLSLAVLTKDYDSLQKAAYLEELRSYAGTSYDFSVRQNAFQYLRDIFGFNDQNLKDLLQACTHPSWQFRSFARKLLEQLIKKGDIKERLMKIAPTLDDPEKKYLNQIVKQP